MDLGVRVSDWDFLLVFCCFYFQFLWVGKSLAVKKIWQGLWLKLGGVFLG